MSESVASSSQAAPSGPQQVPSPRWVFMNADGVVVGDAPNVTDAAPEGAVRVLASGVTGAPAVLHISGGGVADIDKLPVFSIRNGEPATASALMLHKSIPDAFHWVPIRDLPPALATRHVEAFIRCALARFATRAPTGWTANLLRKAAIILGVTRAMSTAYYTVEQNDLVHSETATPMLRYSVLADGTGVVIAEPEIEREAKQVLLAPLEFSADERAVISVLAMSSIGVIPLQGYSLIMMGHHYMSHGSNQSKRAYDAVEKQFWDGLGGSVKEWFAAEIDTVRDMAWHKSCHPVNIAMKMNLAQQERVKEMLKIAGVGSAAARLPAVESEMRAANSYMTLGLTVGTMLEAFGGGMDLSVLSNAMELVRSYSVVGPKSVASPVPGVVDKGTALAYLNRVLLLNSGIIAYCYGFYCAMGDRQTLTAGKPIGESLRKSHSLLKLENGNPAAYMGGRMGYEDYQAAANARRAKGKYEPPVFRLKDGSEQQGMGGF